jgi:hypothetical protein
MLACYKTPWRWSKKIETCRTVSGLYVEVHILSIAHLFVLSIKLSINARMSVLLNSHCLELQELLFIYVQGQLVLIVRTALTCTSLHGVAFQQGCRAQRTNTYTADLLFWGEFTQRIMAFPYRRFGTTYRSHLQGSSSSWKMESVFRSPHFDFPFRGSCL